MKKLLNSLSFISKALLLVLVLIFGWAYINVTNLVKGKKSHDTNNASNNGLWGADSANADMSPPPPPPGACPHIAYFDGQQFKIENDFLCDSFKNSLTKFSQIPVLVRDKFVRIDLLKFNATPERRGGKLILQLQENEAEESFVKWIKFIRVIHQKTSEVIVDADFRGFHILDHSGIKKAIHLPERATRNRNQNITERFRRPELLRENPPETDPVFERGDRIEFLFTDLPTDIPLRLVVKSVYRDWMPGEARSVNFSQLAAIFRGDMKTTVRALATIGGAFFFLSGHSTADALALTPIIFGYEVKSIRFSYEDGQGIFKLAAINKPRAWNYGTEAISLPMGVVKQDGSLRIRAEFTKRHKLAFAGILEDQTEEAYRQETLEISRATSSRIGDVTGLLSPGNKKYLRMIPGDKIDVEFRDLSTTVGGNEKETYLFQSFGYYTALSSEGKKLAGNWQNKISNEAKERLSLLTPISQYINKI